MTESTSWQYHLVFQPGPVRSMWRLTAVSQAGSMATWDLREDEGITEPLTHRRILEEMYGTILEMLDDLSDAHV